MESFTNQNYEDRNEEYQNSTSNREPSVNVFALFSKSLGIFSVFCAIFSTFLLSFICGGLAIVLAILSKGYHSKMERNAKLGFIAGIIGIVFQISALLINVYHIIYVPEFREQFNSLYEEMYGVPVDESINEMLNQLIRSEEGGNIL